jgi:hypothetical protein
MSVFMEKNGIYDGSQVKKSLGNGSSCFGRFYHDEPFGRDEKTHLKMLPIDFPVGGCLFFNQKNGCDLSYPTGYRFAPSFWRKGGGNKKKR